MAKLPAFAISVAALATACAHPGGDRTVELPSSAEIGQYVTSQWDADFNQRFSRFAGRSGQSSQLVSVQNARCEHNWGGSIADCTYDVTASFNGGESVTRQLSSEFERAADGTLNEVIIMWHERKR